MERLEIEYTETKRGKRSMYLVSTNVGVAVKGAAITAMWYNGTATILTENLGIMGQTTDSVAVNTKGARPGAAMRMRRCRARRRAGFRCVTVEIHRSKIDTLVRGGLLRADERDDEGAVVDALSQYIEQTLGSAS